MKLRDKLIQETILVPMQATNKEGANQELLTHLQLMDILSATVQLFTNIKEQEKAFSSSAGRGIAYPHSTSMEVDELVCVLGVSTKGIDFNSPDRQLCHLILMTLSPDEDPCEHRKFITRFRMMCNNPDVRFKLLDVLVVLLFFVFCSLSLLSGGILHKIGVIYNMKKAQSGECTRNPEFMWRDCVDACMEHDPGNYVSPILRTVFTS